MRKVEPIRQIWDLLSRHEKEIFLFARRIPGEPSRPDRLLRALARLTATPTSRRNG